MTRVLKLAIVAVVLYVLWTKVVQPWAHKPVDITGVSAARSQATAMGAPTCPESAAAASQIWGSGLGAFANPPYDIGQWGAFRSRVDTALATADGACLACSSESCLKAREAVSNLRAVVSSVDSTIRSGSAPPSDIVQQQEKIDNDIEAARQLVREGK
jgi:hypothetical protein